jgi:hypothetical protein
MKILLLFVCTLSAMEDNLHDSNRPKEKEIALSASMLELPPFKNHDVARPNTPNQSERKNPPYEPLPIKNKKGCCNLY